MKAIYPGSFDPITKGHLNIIERSAKVFDEVVVAITFNPDKMNFTFNLDDRLAMIQKSCAHLNNVTITTSTQLTVALAKEVGAGVIVRGIRAVMDYEKELQNATANMHLDHEIETIFFVSEPEFSFISSTAVKEIAMFDGDISTFVDPHVEDALRQYFAKDK